MNCEKFQTIVSDLAQEVLMEAGEQAAAVQHAGECRDCATSLDQERALTLGLRSLADEMKGLSAPPQLEAKMLAAFRERKSAKPVVVPLQPRRNRSWYWAAAIAAGLLIAFGMFVVRGSFFKPQDKAIVKSPAGADPSIASKPKEQPKEQSADGTDPKTFEPQRVPKRNTLAVQRKPKSNRDESTNAVASTASNQSAAPVEVTTDFYPIGYSNTPNLQEGGQLLRVELPRAAIARFGLPVNMDRAGQRVKADVLVGSDGLAQAIRFVQ